MSILVFCINNDKKSIRLSAWTENPDENEDDNDEGGTDESTPDKLTYMMPVATNADLETKSSKERAAVKMKLMKDLYMQTLKLNKLQRKYVQSLKNGSMPGQNNKTKQANDNENDNDEGATVDSTPDKLTDNIPVATNADLETKSSEEKDVVKMKLMKDLYMQKLKLNELQQMYAQSLKNGSMPDQTNKTRHANENKNDNDEGGTDDSIPDKLTLDMPLATNADLETKSSEEKAAVKMKLMKDLYMQKLKLNKLQQMYAQSLKNGSMPGQNNKTRLAFQELIRKKKVADEGRLRTAMKYIQALKRKLLKESDNLEISMMTPQSPIGGPNENIETPPEAVINSYQPESNDKPSLKEIEEKVQKAIRISNEHAAKDNKDKDDSKNPKKLQKAKEDVNDGILPDTNNNNGGANKENAKDNNGGANKENTKENKEEEIKENTKENKEAANKENEKENNSGANKENAKENEGEENKENSKDNKGEANDKKEENAKEEYKEKETEEGDKNKLEIEKLKKEDKTNAKNKQKDKNSKEEKTTDSESSENAKNVGSVKPQNSSSCLDCSGQTYNDKIKNSSSCDCGSKISGQNTSISCPESCQSCADQTCGGQSNNCQDSCGSKVKKARSHTGCIQVCEEDDDTKEVQNCIQICPKDQHKRIITCRADEDCKPLLTSIKNAYKLFSRTLHSTRTVHNIKIVYNSAHHNTRTVHDKRRAHVKKIVHNSTYHNTRTVHDKERVHDKGRAHDKGRSHVKQIVHKKRTKHNKKHKDKNRRT